ncbi:MAG: NifB/NifX family molybdenum-iron cluster-binding protein [Candidatus Altiarchaeota archaeon]
MKILIATMKGNLEDDVSPVFGRCSNFTVVECEEGGIKEASVIENPGAYATGGAGITAAQTAVNEKAEVAIAGNFGPKAAAVLNQSNVKMVQASGNARKAVQDYLEEKITPLEGPSVKDHFGMGCRGRGQAKGSHGRSGGKWR